MRNNYTTYIVATVGRITLNLLPIMLFQYAQNSTDYTLNYVPNLPIVLKVCPFISGRSKFVCSNYYTTLLGATSQLHHQSQTRPSHLRGDLPADYMDHVLLFL